MSEGSPLLGGKRGACCAEEGTRSVGVSAPILRSPPERQLKQAPAVSLGYEFYFSVSIRMNGFGLPGGGLAAPLTTSMPSKVTRPVAVTFALPSLASRLVDGRLHRSGAGPRNVEIDEVSLGVTDDQDGGRSADGDALEIRGARDGGWSLSSAPVDRAFGTESARNWILAVGFRSSVSGDWKKRVVSTSRVPSTIVPSSHSQGADQNAEAVSSKVVSFTADAGVDTVTSADTAPTSTTTEHHRAEVAILTI